MDKLLVDRSVVEQALDMLERGRFANKDVDDLEALCDVLHAALEQPQVEQKPVAWAVMQDGAICWEADYPFSNEPGWCDSDQQSVPLYTHPQPKRQPLTDEEIAYCIFEARLGAEGAFKRNGSSSYRIARAIERAHGIGGEA